MWFPKTVKHHSTQTGKEDWTQTVVVEQAEWDADVPDRVFTIAGLGLDEGQPVAFPEIKNDYDHPTWGKNGLDTVNTIGKMSSEIYAEKLAQAAAQNPPVPDVAPSNRRAYTTGAIVLAVLAAAAGVLLAVRRRIARHGT